MITAPDRTRFVATYGHVFEHSPWVVERAWAARPFVDDHSLFKAFMDAVRQAGRDDKLKLFRAHPALGVRQALTEASASEQSTAGLQNLNADEFNRFVALNADYQEKFGFPFIICVRLHTKASIFAAFQRRLANDEATEFEQAFTEIAAITGLRLMDMKLETTA